MAGNKHGHALRLKRDNYEALKKNIAELAKLEVLVGFPEDTTKRQEDAGTTTKGKADLGQASEITNAALGYIHDRGAPDANIPARPFMEPGINSARDAITKHLVATAMAVVRATNKPMAIPLRARLDRVGIAAMLGIKRKINEGIAPPLSDATLRERARRGRKGAKQELANRDQGLAPSTALAKPLIDTGQLRNAVNYVIRDRKKRK